MIDNKIKATIICGFPGVGKSTYAANRCDADDAESSAFSHIFNPDAPDSREKNPGFPHNYIDYIKKMGSKCGYGIVLVSSHREVRRALRESGIPYIAAVPEKSLKDEYMARYVMRGSPYALIDLLYHKWDEFLDEIEQEGAPIIHLKEGQYLSDVLPK